MKIFTAIKESFFKSLKGEEKLWKVFWLWGVLLYVVSIGIGLLSIGVKPFVIWFHPIIGILGIILIFIYPIIFCFSIWRNSKNTESKSFKYASLIYIFLFLQAHIMLSFFTLLGSMSLIFF